MSVNRRQFVALLAGLSAPVVAIGAEQRKPVVALVGIGDLSRPPLSALVDALRKAGYAPGKNIEYLPPISGSGGYEALKPLATAAVEKRADVIFAYSGTAALAAKAATRSIPVVMTINFDPVERGLVKNLARPEANVTGVVGNSQLLVAKRVEVLRELKPGIRRLGVIASAGSETQARSLKSIQGAAAKLGITVETAPIGKPEELDAVLARLAEKRVDALMMTPAALYDARMSDIVRWAAMRKVPTIYSGPRPVRSGGLISYGPDTAALMTRAADYIVRILKGAKVSELPVEQLEKYELVINLKAAKALGITVPHSLLVRADEIIQ